MYLISTVFSGSGEAAPSASGTAWISVLLLMAFALLVALLLRFALRAGNQALSLDSRREQD